ncbi:MAG: CBS domain-containing protein [Nanoarchaeota archaeon]|nr:CBS domain-containing protein [Nanoarchaeota archaeon]
MSSAVSDFRNQIKRYKYSYNLKMFSLLIKKHIKRKVGSVMTKKVITVDWETSLSEAADIMRELSISSLIITKNKTPAGILTEQDFVRKIGPKTNIIKDIFTDNIVSIAPNKTIFEASQVMLNNHFRKLVVMKKDNMVGIITQTDLVRALSAFGTTTMIESIDVPLVEDVMTDEIVSIPKTTTLDQARKIMAAHKFGCLVVKDELPGIITERDIVSEYSKDPRRLTSFTVENCMTCPVSTIDPKENVFRANIIMLRKGFRRLPVSNTAKLMGLVTETDLMRGMYQFIVDAQAKVKMKKFISIDVEKVK